MSFLQDDILDGVLDTIFGDATWPLVPPGTWYLALLTTLPDPDGTGGVEAAYTDYARLAVSNDLTEWPSAAAGEKSNANLLDFGVAGSGPTVVVGVALLDSPSGSIASSLWYVGDLVGGSVSIANGGDANFQPGAIVISRCA
jgi:hypothetical protein